MFVKHPYDLVTHTRFDVIIKYLYAKAIKNGYNTQYFREMYKEHLILWNGFKEYNNPDKNSFEAFDNIFKDLIKTIGEDGFDNSISMIPVHDNKYILNGAHRLAAAIVSNKVVACINGKDGVDGMSQCGWSLFKKLGLDKSYADRVAIEYTKLKRNTHMVFLFPAAPEKTNEVLQILNTHGNVFYDKSVSLNNTGSFNLMRELYLDESWAGNFRTNFGGYRDKQRLCYPNYEPTRVFLVEFDDLDVSIKVKGLIRDIYKIGKHSVHINDTHEETVRLAKLMFNNNSIHNLNHAKTVDYKVFDNCLVDFKDRIDELGLDIDDYCIGGSSPLSAYGLREGNDLDYLHFDPTLVTNSADLIHSHNDYGVDKYHLGRDEIIYEPQNHFYHRGVKFASLEVVKKLKEKRGEPKDIIDIKLINSVI